MPRVLGIAPLLALLMLCGCARRMPEVSLAGVDPALIQRCTEGPGAILVLEERFEAIWGGGYDASRAQLLGEENAGDVTSAPNPTTPVRRQVLKVLSEQGAQLASTFEVIHYRERVPPVEVHVWMEDKSERAISITPVGTTALADWPCDSAYPRQTTFRIATLKPGDLVEILSPLSGPDTMPWRFGSDRFCLARGKATFGNPSDDYRLDAPAVVVDASGGVIITSAPKAYPTVFEQTKALMPLSTDRIPFVQRAFHCPGWSHLRGRIFHTSLWLARSGSISGRERVNPFLLSEVKDGEFRRRIQAVADWLQQHLVLEEPAGPYWMRWMPRLSAEQTASAKRANPGSAAVLVFRILEDCGLKPRLALLHTHPRNPFTEELRTPAQFDTLAVVVADETGRDNWLVPGLPYDPEQQPPTSLQGRRALVLERWFADRDPGGGKCHGAGEQLVVCQLASPEPVEVRLVTIGSAP